MYYKHEAGHSGVQWMADENEPVTIHNTPAEERVPLFLLGDRDSGVRWKTTDPYFISSKPYDGRTEYIGLAGFIDGDEARTWELSK
jgi:hypothetical protein